MTSDRIERLHNEASEHYLNGNYEAALEAWQAVLRADPGHAEALEGVRMVGLLSDKPAVEFGDLPDDPEPQFELSLPSDALDSEPGVGAAHPSGATAGAMEPAKPLPSRTPSDAVPGAVPSAPTPGSSAEGEIDRSLDAFFELMPNPLAKGGATLQAGPAAEVDPTATLPVFDPIAEVASPPADAINGPHLDERDPDRQGQGIDFGDVDAVAAIPLAGPEDSTTGAASDQPAEGESDGEGYSLEPVPESQRRRGSEASGGPSPAAIELRRRVGALLRDAKTKMDEGDRDGALAVIARVYILDEDNAEARAFEAKLRESESRNHAEIDQWLTEGIQAFDAGRIDEAKDLFTHVLDRSPEHREALHYMEAITEREGAPGAPDEDLLASPDLLGAPPPAASPAPSVPAVEEIGLARDPSAVPLASRDEASEDAAPSPVPSRERRARAVEPAIPVPRFRRATPKWVFVAAAAIVVLAAAALVVPKVLNTAGDAAPEAPSPVPRKAARPRPAEVAPPAPALPSPSVSELVQRAERALREGDYGAAVIAYNDAIRVDPADERARRGLELAAQRYRARQAEQEQLERVRMAFNDGEYASALRVMYRLPDSVDRATVERWKASGWFNLGVVALRAGEPAQAIGHFDEVLAIRADPEAEKWRTFAVKYRNAPKDRSYYAPVEAIPFRRLED